MSDEIFAMKTGERLKVLKKIGDGGQGEVFLAEDLANGKQYALKVGRSDSDDRLKREIEIFRMLKRANVAGVPCLHFVGGDDKSTWFAMDYVPGVPLDEFRRKHGPFEFSQVLSLGIELATTIEMVHAAGLAHRDVCPRNIVISDRKPVLIDFGYSKAMALKTMTKSNFGFGQLAYSAPEQNSAMIADHRTEVFRLCDVYSFGAVLFFLAVGRPPEHKEYDRNKPPTEHYWPCFESIGIDHPDFEQLVLNCLRICPAERPTSLFEIRSTLMEISAGRDCMVVVNPISTGRQSQSWRNSTGHLMRKYLLPFGHEERLERLWAEWIILAATDNGLFEADKKYQDATEGFKYLHQELHITAEKICNQLVEKGVFGWKRNDSMNQMFYLKDIDKTVIPTLREYTKHRAPPFLESELRRALKQLAKFKAKEEIWEMNLDECSVSNNAAILSTKEQRDNETLEVLTSVLATPGCHLRVIAEYGTWMRRKPAIDLFKKIAASPKDHQIIVILAEPPPFSSEGFVEWAESVYFLSAFGANLHVMSDGHTDHLTLGNGIAVDFKRYQTNDFISYGVQRDNLKLENLRQRFENYLKSGFTVPLSKWRENNPVILSGDDFDFLAAGSFELDITYNDKHKAQTRRGIDELVDRCWTQEINRRGGIESKDFENNPKVRLAGFRWVDQRLVIGTGPTDYKQFWGTNRRISDLRKILGEDDDISSYLSNALAVNVTLITADHKIIIGKRNDGLAESGGMLHVIGGHVEQEHVSPDFKVDAVQAIRDEIDEELEFQGKVKEIVCRGLVRAGNTLKPEIVFSGKLECDFDKIRSKSEHTVLYPVDATPKELADFLLKNRHRIVATGKASLVAFGFSSFGVEWMIDVLDSLNQEELRSGLNRQNPDGTDISPSSVDARNGVRTDLGTNR